MGYDIPGLTDGGIAGGGSTSSRKNNATITDHAVFVSIKRADVRGNAWATWYALAVDATVVEAAGGLRHGVLGSGC